MTEGGFVRDDKNNKNSDIKLEDLMDNTTSEAEQQAKARQRRKRRLEEDKSQDRRKLDRTKEDIKQEQKAQQAALYKLERDIDDTKTLDDINKINISNYNLPTNKKRAIQDKYNKRKQELEVEKYERELDDAKAKQAPARTAAKALPIFLQPLANYFLNKGISKEQKNLKKAKKKKRRKVFFNITGIMAAASGFLFLTLLLLVIAAGSMTSILLSHPEAIRELYENNLLGDAMYMGNVTEDVVVDGKVIVKGNPASRPGCFIYNGVRYCGNCKVVNEGQEQSNCQEGTTNYDSAGQGDLTVEATQWAKTFEASFIGDSLGVGVQTELVKYIPKLHYDVLTSRRLIYQSADSTDPLNGLQALRTLKEDNNLKEVLIVALGTNGGLKQDDLKTFISEVPDTVKSIIFINSGSQGGSGDYDKIDTEDISKQIKELAKTNQKVSYLDWLTYSQKEGWDKLTSDSVHLNDTGNQVYAKFITQGLYDILVNTKNNTCSVGSQNISDNKDDSKLREGVSVYESEGIQDWPRKVMNMGTNIFTDVKEISGFRSGDSGDHGKGLAIDFMVPVGSHDNKTDLGDVIAQWVVDNMEALNVSYVIWEQRIYGSWDKQWVDMEDRGSVTENHFDHPHVSFNEGSGDLDKVQLPTKGAIELPDVISARGGVSTGLEDTPTQTDTHGEPNTEDSVKETTQVDTTKLGDTGISGTHDLYNMTDKEYQQYKMEEQLIEARGTTETDNEQDPETFYCQDNCVVTEQEKEVGTGNIKAIQKGKTWQDDNILLTDLGYTTDTVTPQTIDEYINTVAPNDNGIKGMGAVFYEAGQKSGYDPRYILAHMIHETNWGRSTIWKDKNNAFGWMAYDDTPYDSAKDFETKEKGIIEGAQMIYKNYYVDHSQKNLKDMHRDPDTSRNHNYATDPEWHTKIGAIMLSMETTMGPSTGGSVVQGSNNGQQATTPTGLNLGRSCLINDVSFNNLPYPPEDMNISSFYHDGNYGMGTPHGGADMTYKHNGSGPIYSVDAGEVTEVVTNCSVGDTDCGYTWGNYIKIKHPNVGDGKYETLYAHLEKGSITLKVGDNVSAGQEIGTMGTTGFSTGIHLHFELWYNGSRIDNYPYFAWKDATYQPGWENYKGPHTGELCVPGATQKGQQSSDNRSQTCEINGEEEQNTGNGLIGNDNPEKVYNFFKGHGFSDAAIAGILGNLKQESDVQARLVQGIYDKSTYTMSDEELDKIMKRSIYVWSDPNIPSEGIGPAMGVSQWEHTAFYGGELRPGRWENLMAWAKKNGYSHWDLEAQLEYIIREMGIVKDPDVPLEYGTSLINNGGPWSRGFVGITGMENFQKATDITKATYTYFQYNRAGTPHMDNRIAYAKEFYAQMANWS